MKWKTQDTYSSLLIIAISTLACLLPFVGKAFHIDDPLFVWSARHIQSDPVNFYGFKVNWNGWEEPMSVVTKNPPLAAYYMAFAGALFGWNEVVLHAWFLLPALALVAGTWFLARSFCAHPLAAAFITITAPVFLLSGTSVMCDTMMLAFWVWAVVFWMAGLAQNSPARLCAAALLISACELTKYFGLGLIPLLLVYSLMERRRVGIWLAWLMIPVLAIVFYQWMTRQLYGRGSLFDAAAYAANLRMGGNLLERILTGLAFSGGCIVILLPLALLLWGRKALAGWMLAVVLIGLLVVALKKVNIFSVLQQGHVQWLFLAQFSCLVVAGASLIALAGMDWIRRRTPSSMLLLLWVSGTFLFACVVNWTVSGRNILPMLPAVSLLLVRRLEQRNASSRQHIMGRLCAPLGFSLVVALLIAWADYREAGSARDAATAILRRADTDAARVWFEGHWGFQYYMEQQGARPLDRDHLRLSLHDVIVVPSENSYLFPLQPDHVIFWFEHDGGTLPWLATMSIRSGAGYYSDGWGPLPFVFGRAPADRYLVFRVQ
jgi:4-amino-4-deoxy-L-arabinose transferase-like glycosyltransferase